MLATALLGSTVHARSNGEDIRLELQPRVCTLGADEQMCRTTVRAQWRAPQDESLCLIIVNRPDVKRCWEDYSEGEYAVELAFSEDVVFQLRDPDLQRVLTQAAVTVIREALQFRRRRRQPWNLFY